MMGMFVAAIALVISLSAQVFCSGMFEVSILAIYNYRGQKEDGSCCAGSHDVPPCSMECRTFFSICLLHYVTSVPDRPVCTFGRRITPVLGGNNINDTALSALNFFPLRLPFNYAWPGNFTLVIDVIHDVFHNNSTSDASQRISRTAVTKMLHPPSNWIKDTSVTEAVNLHFRYRVVCDDNYYDVTCYRICLPRDDSLGHYICDENGNKLCLPGWEGENCQTARCPCSQSRGHCDTPFNCTCVSGWTGENCQDCVVHSNCVHGYCHEPLQCICKERWTGQFCDIDTRYCLNHDPCQHGGVCRFDSTTNYTCLCPDGYTGPNCEFPLCYDGFCLNKGLCENGKRGGECLCKPEYHGKKCEHVVKSCEQVSCEHDGTCVIGNHGAACSCTEIYTGKYCEKLIDFCESNPCLNGARCLNAYGGYVCECAEGYIGQHCEIKLDPCRDTVCLNGGTCKSSSSGYIAMCTCAEFFTGYRCEIPFNPCRGINCQNGGHCVDLSPTDFYCSCPLGYKGLYCQEKDNLCERVTCLNGGVCKSYTNYTKCICDPRYGGEFCEKYLLLSDQSVTHPSVDRNLVYVNNAVYLFNSTYMYIILIYVIHSCLL